MNYWLISPDESTQEAGLTARQALYDQLVTFHALLTRNQKSNQRFPRMSVEKEQISVPNSLGLRVVSTFPEEQLSEQQF